jgi:predicted RNA-binding protein with TRAM domain
MRQATRKGLMTVAAATGVIAAAGGQAHAHSASASGSATGSPGVLSGNTVQAPVHAPVNVCGNTVNVVGVLNPAAGNSCGNHSHGHSGHGESGAYGDSSGTGGSGAGGSGGAQASGYTSDSPGVASGNTVQVPVYAPVNACGNSVDVVGVLNPAAGNSCGNHSHHHPGGHGDPGGSGGSGGAQAEGHASDSPGVASGNHVQAPVHAPVNVCGNSVDIIGVGNAAMGNDCANEDTGGGHTTPPGDGDGTTPPGTNPPGTNPPGTTPPGTNPPGTPEQPGTPGTPEQPGTPGTPVTPGTPATPPNLGGPAPGDQGHGNLPGAQSVTQLADTGSGLPLGTAASLGAGALLAGTVLYRRARASA